MIRWFSSRAVIRALQSSSLWFSGLKILRYRILQVADHWLEKPEHLSFDLGTQPDRNWGVVDATVPPSLDR